MAIKLQNTNSLSYFIILLKKYSTGSLRQSQNQRSMQQETQKHNKKNTHTHPEELYFLDPFSSNRHCLLRRRRFPQQPRELLIRLSPFPPCLSPRILNCGPNRHQKTLIRILKTTINSRPKRCCKKKRLQVETNLAADIRMKSFTQLETRQDSQLTILLPPCLSIALKSSIVDQIDTKNAHSNPQTQHFTSRRKT